MASAVSKWWGAASRRMVGQRALSSAGSSSIRDDRWTMVEAEVCGRGDKKTKKGKRFKGSYGKARPSKDKMIQRFKDKVEVPRSTPWPLPFKLI